jgi:hypothetical protein
MDNAGAWALQYQTYEVHFAPEFHFGEWARYRDALGETAFLREQAEAIAETLRERGLRVVIEEPAKPQIEPQWRSVGL